MKVFDMIVAERRHMAALLATLTPAQLRTPSLCAAWTVHDIGAHLISYLRLGQLKIYYAIARTGADFDRFNIDLTRRYARRPSAEIAAYLDEYASSRVTIPRSGYDPVLADIVLHDLDVRRPLGIARTLDEDRLRVVFGHLAGVPSPGFAMRGRLAGLRLEATDTGWVRGTGAPVRGPAESLLLAMAGRAGALSEVDGDGVELLRSRLSTPKPGLLRRLSAPARVLLSPPPPDRRHRDAVAP